MSIETTVRQCLEEEYASGKTHQEISDAHHISRSFIQSLLTGRRNYSGISLKHLEQMFPRATLNLNGNGNITQTASHVSVKNGSVNSISVHSPPASADQIRARIIAALIPLEIPSDALQCVLRTINELDLN